MRQVYVIGVAHSRFGKFLDRSIKSFCAEVVPAVLSDAGIDKSQIEAVFFGNAMQGLVTGQEMIRGQIALRPLGIEGVPFVNTENACATGSTAFHLAWQSVAGGHSEVALVVGAEKLYMDDAEKMFKNYDAGMDVEILEKLASDWAAQAKAFGGQTGDAGAGGRRTIAMDLYANACRLHMNSYGTTQEDLAVVASKNHNHSVHNPYAQYRKPMTVEEVMAGRPVVFPLTVPMCAPIGDGAAASIICSDEFLKRLKDARPVKILASVFASGRDRPEGFGPESISGRLGKKAFAVAGVGPKDINVLEVHDASAIGELIQFEQLGFCEMGQGASIARSGATTVGGRIPVNPSGGLVSKGHPLGATGLSQIFEIVTQLRGNAGARQVEGARLGMTENGGGSLGVEEASMTVHIFQGMK